MRNARIERGQYQSDLAKIFKVTTDTVTNWELNRNTISRFYHPIIQEYLKYMPKEYEMSDISYKLIRYRWENGLSIKQLAENICVHYTCVQNAEAGKYSTQKNTARKIELFLHSI